MSDQWTATEKDGKWTIAATPEFKKFLDSVYPPKNAEVSERIAADFRAWLDLMKSVA